LVSIDRRRLNDPRLWRPWLNIDQAKVEHPRTVDINGILTFRTVREWADKKSENGRMACLYHMAAYIRWREELRLSTNPDQWVEECRNGTNKAIKRYPLSLST
jgi:hypothetical protein